MTTPQENIFAMHADTEPEDKWDLGWASPADWWADQLEMVGGTVREQLEAAKQKVTAAGCPERALYESLHRLQQDVSLPAANWRRYGKHFGDAAKGLETAVRRVRRAAETAVMLKAIGAGDSTPFTREPLLDSPEFGELSARLRSLQKVCDNKAKTARRKRSGGIYDAQNACLDEILRHTPGKFPAEAIAVLISTVTQTSVTGHSLRMRRSRKGKRVRKAPTRSSPKTIRGREARPKPPRFVAIE